MDKVCAGCLVSQPTGSFPKLKSGRPAGKCRGCNRLRRAELRRTDAGRERDKRRHRRSRYGATREQVLGMLEAQGRQCVGCRVPVDESSHLDHDHATGVLRGMLCSHCNSALGLLRDDLLTTMRLARYLAGDNARMAPALAVA